MDATQPIFLNADVGEGAPCDAELIPHVGGVNISCGAHAGDVADQQQAIDHALVHGCRLGAHPSYPDRDNFGRKVISMSLSDLVGSLHEQLTALDTILAARGAQMDYIKPHGALYNQMAHDAEFATQILTALRVWRPLPVMVLAQSQAQQAAHALGVPYVREGFLDRCYMDDGQLVPRSAPHSVHSDVKVAQRQAHAFFSGRPITTESGASLSIEVDSLCVHGDTPQAVAFLQAVLPVTPVQPARH